MRLTHRPVAEQDLAAICAFTQSPAELFYCFPKADFPLSPAQLQAAIEQRSDSTAVLLDGSVVAFANLYRWESGGVCAIGNVMVAPAARGRGVARYLIEQMNAIAFARHRAREVTVSCFHQNLAGLLLYPQLGFTAYGIEERQDKSGQRVALIHLRLLRAAAI
ncbi:MAG: GNAT family N-acetyltransferase [Pseudomonadaceae bacterium]|nr:GNAT family N-acetyltransferase [Pseudomonadaceae bacterium]